MSKFDDDLIDNVRKYPILYRCKGKNYRNMIKKGNCWIKIAANLNKTPEECKSKWRNIRDNYIKYKKKKITGAGLSYSKYDDERLNFLSDSFDEGETSITVDNSASNDPIQITYECVKEEYDSSEEVPLSESKFDMGTTSSTSTEHPATYASAIITTNYDVSSKAESSQLDLVPPPPKRAMKRKIDSIIDELKKDREERNVILQQLVSKATGSEGKSPTHNFFSSMADIVSKFPPEKIAETRVKICNLVSDMEIALLRDRNNY